MPEEILNIESQSQQIETYDLRGREYMIMVPGSLKDYYALTEAKADYLEEGQIIMNSPSSYKHEKIFAELLFQFKIITNQIGGEVLGSKSPIALGDNRFEPDLIYISKDNSGEFTDGITFFGTPDLVVEILSKSTRTYDINTKLPKYKVHRIPEIWIVDPEKELTTIYNKTNNDYQESIFNFDEDIISQIISELKIQIK